MLFQHAFKIIGMNVALIFTGYSPFALSSNNFYTESVRIKSDHVLQPQPRRLPNFYREYSRAPVENVCFANAALVFLYYTAINDQQLYDSLLNWKESEDKSKSRIAENIDLIFRFISGNVDFSHKEIGNWILEIFEELRTLSYKSKEKPTPDISRWGYATADSEEFLRALLTELGYAKKITTTPWFFLEHKWRWQPLRRFVDNDFILGMGVHLNSHGIEEDYLDLCRIIDKEFAPEQIEMKGYFDKATGNFVGDSTKPMQRLLQVKTLTGAAPETVWLQINHLAPEVEHHGSLYNYRNINLTFDNGIANYELVAVLHRTNGHYFAEGRVRGSIEEDLFQTHDDMLEGGNEHVEQPAELRPAKTIRILAYRRVDVFSHPRCY